MKPASFRPAAPQLPRRQPLRSSQEAEKERKSVERSEPAGLQRHQAQQVGYLLAAKLNGNAVTDSDELRRLRDANETMHDARMALQHGRGNVREDVEPSGGHNRSVAMYRTLLFRKDSECRGWWGWLW